MGFDWVWFLSVWQTGPAGQQVSRSNPEWREDSRRRCRTCARKTSPAPASRSPATRCIQDLGGDAALARLRERLRERGPAADARLRPQSHRPRSSLGRGPSRVLHRRARSSTWPARRRTTPGSSARGGDLLLAYGRDPVLPRLARHAAAQLRQPGHAGGDDRRAAEDRRAVRRRALRHGHAGPARRLRADLGQLRPRPFWPKATRRVRRARSRTSASWPRSTGTWSGRCSSRASTTPTTSGSTTACARATPGRCASISTPGSTTRTSWPASWRTTTSRGPRRRSRRTCTRPRPSSPSCRPGCASSTRASSRAARSASRPTSAAARTSRIDQELRAVLRPAARRAAPAGRPRRRSGNCSNALPPGTATGPATASSPSPGKARTASGCWSP